MCNYIYTFLVSVQHDLKCKKIIFSKVAYFFFSRFEKIKNVGDSNVPSVWFPIEGLELRDARRLKNGGNRHRLSLSEDGSSKMSKQSRSLKPRPPPTVLNGTPGGRLRFLAFAFSQPLTSSLLLLNSCRRLHLWVLGESRGVPGKIGGAAEKKKQPTVPSCPGC